MGGSAFDEEAGSASSPLIVMLSRADFASVLPADAWYLHRNPDGSISICSTDGWSIASLARSELTEQLRALGSVPNGPNGRPANELLNEAPAADGGVRWDDALLRTAWALGARYRVAQDRLRQLESDLASRSVSRSTLELVLWMAFHSAGFRGDTRVYGLGGPNEVTIQPDARMPAYGALMLPPADLRNEGGRYPVCRTTSQSELQQLRTAPPAANPFQFEEWIFLGIIAFAAISATYLASRPVRSTDFPIRKKRRRS